ncbi:MAG: acyltransferase family protein [Eubacteriales bacterium]|nr:acyltransferase family protein [Eubacteriales bacterium]
MVRAGHSSHRYAFDSLRALSFLGVFLYHWNPRLFPHAYLGVVGFFCLAGYLSMRKVIWQETAGLARPQLWASLKQKANKLYPPLLLLLFILSLTMIGLFPMFLDHFAGQLRSAILGFNNWWQISLGDSYFQGQAYLKPLTHIWALSLEFQFYLIFSLTVERFYRAEERNLWLFQFVLLSLGSGAFLWLLSQGVEDPTRVYYGTDTRFFSFSLGALMALLQEPGLARLAQQPPYKEWQVAPNYPRTENWKQGQPISPRGLPKGEATTYEKAVSFSRNLVVLLFFLLALASYFLPFSLWDMVRWGLPAYSLLYVGLLALTADGQNFLERVGAYRLTQWVCSRSYEIYLWHYPVFVILERLLASYLIPAWALAAGQLVLALILSELAYRLLGYLRAGRLPWRNLSYASLLGMVLVLVLLFTPWLQLYVWTGGAEFRKLEADLAEAEAKLQARKEEAASRREADLTREEGSASSDSASPQSQHSGTRPTESRTAESNPAPTSKPSRARGPGGWEIKGELTIPPAQTIDPDDWQYDMMRQDMVDFNELKGDFLIDLDFYDKHRDISISMIGDSVSVINSYYIFPYLPGLDLDALSNRQMWELWDIYQAVKARGPLGEIMVVALGSNGEIDSESLTKVWRDLAGKPLVLVNIVLPYAITEAERNQAINDFVESHDQVYLVDWHANAKARPDFFQEDYIHPSELGSKAYCQLLTAKLMEIIQLYEESELLTWETSSTQFYSP